MENKVRALDRIAVCTGDANLRRHIQGLLAQFSSRNVTPESLCEVAHQDDLLQLEGFAVAILTFVKSPQTNQADTDSAFHEFAEFIPRLKQHRKSAQVIVAYKGKFNVEQSCTLISSGISSIVDMEQLDFAVRLTEKIESALDRWNELRGRHEFSETADTADVHGLVGSSAKLTNVLFQAKRAARVSDVPVLIYGESGTGKQRIAEYVHYNDAKRHDRPFLSVNCAAISGSLAESELFGHKKGAFTGATEDRGGYFRSADGGTVLLDEVSELEPSLQPKILRVLQEALVRPVGEDKEYKVDIRIIAATNRDLATLVESGQFRLDLYQRLKVIQLTVPALRDRREDIPELFQAFLRKYENYYDSPVCDVDPQVYSILAETLGTGNIRELENTVRQILVFKEKGDRIEIEDLPPELIQSNRKSSLSDPTPDVPEQMIDALARGSRQLSHVMDDFEKSILNRLSYQELSQTQLAENLGITRRTLYNKLQKYDIRRS